MLHSLSQDKIIINQTTETFDECASRNCTMRTYSYNISKKNQGIILYFTKRHKKRNI